MASTGDACSCRRTSVPRACQTDTSGGAQTFRESERFSGHTAAKQSASAFEHFRRLCRSHCRLHPHSGTTKRNVNMRHRVLLGLGALAVLGAAVGGVLAASTSSSKAPAATRPAISGSASSSPQSSPVQPPTTMTTQAAPPPATVTIPAAPPPTTIAPRIAPTPGTVPRPAASPPITMTTQATPPPPTVTIPPVPPPTTAPPTTAAPPNPNGPQQGGGDGDADNFGGPSDGDGNK